MRVHVSKTVQVTSASLSCPCKCVTEYWPMDYCGRHNFAKHAQQLAVASSSVQLLLQMIPVIISNSCLSLEILACIKPMAEIFWNLNN